MLTSQVENSLTKSFCSYIWPHSVGCGSVSALTSKSKAVTVSASERHKAFSAGAGPLCPCSVMTAHTLSLVPPRFLGAGRGQDQVLEHLCQLILCVAANNQKKKFYFGLVTYCHEVLFLLHCGEPDHCFVLAWGTEAPPCPGPRTGGSSWRCGAQTQFPVR